MTTVRDFTQVFDAYAQFEELSLSKCIEDETIISTEDGVYKTKTLYKFNVEINKCHIIIFYSQIYR